MDIYEYTDYKRFVADCLRRMPKKGRGQLTKMAQDIGTTSSLMSQIFRGPKNLTEEHAQGLAEYLGLNTKETYFFLLLVQKQRAGTERLKKLLAEQIERMQRDAHTVKGRIHPDRILSFEQQAVYYSSWIYAAVHALSALDEKQSPQSLSERLRIPVATAKQAMEWLLKNGLCIEQDGKFSVGLRSIYVPADSQLVIRHHANWRVRALELMPRYSEADFFFTAPISLSESDLRDLRKELTLFVERAANMVEKSKSESVACLNLDLFSF